MAKKPKVKRVDPTKDPIFVLPPYKVEQVFTTYAETMDWGLELLNIPSLWRQSKGEGVRVAVLDTGAALTHPDLKNAILSAKDFTGSRAGPSDIIGHGSHVAGIIAARENSSGVIGIAPLCQLLIGKVLGDSGAGSAPWIAKGIYWAIEKKAHIISMSLGSPVEIPLIHEAIKEAIKAGIFIVAAAGNEGPTIDTIGYPAKWPEVISVGSIDRRRQISSFSSRGDRVDICAPGDQILSCYPPTGLAKLSGTSMAAPFVSGVVALKISRQMKFPNGEPINTQQELLKVLRESATDAGAKGRDPNYGYGIIDPAKLLAYHSPSIALSIPGLTLDKSDLSNSGKAKLAEFIANTDDEEISLRIRVR